MLLAISWVVRYPDIIASEAIITTQIPPQKEYARISGKIQAILIEDNERVIEGQVLGILENTANFEDVFRLKSLLSTIKTDNKNFFFPIDSLPVLFLGDIETQYAMFENNYIQYKLNLELEPFSNEALANTYSISELNRRLRGMHAQKVINETEIEFKKRDLERNKSLFKKGVISAQAYENKQLEFARSERDFMNFEASISQIRENISNARKISKGTEINRVKEEMSLRKNVIQSFNQLKKSIKDWEHRYAFKSNINGKVSFLNYWNVNQSVKEGDLVFTVIPSENSTFLAKLKSPAQNSGKIKIGQVVNIKLKNYPETEFGVLKGTVADISILPNKDGLYLLDAKLPEKLLTSYKKEIEFKQEMSGIAEIVTEDLRLIERFFYEFKDLFKR